MIESLLVSLAVGTIWFWLILLIASIIIITCVEHQHYPIPTIVLILMGIIYWKTIVALPWSVISIIVGTFAIVGAIWSTFQWFRLVQRKATKYREQYGDILTGIQMHELKEDISASQHKALITGWIAFWPWDMFWTFTGDFFNMIYDTLSNVYQGISNRAVGKFTVAAPKVDTKGFYVNEDSNRRKNYE